MSNDTIKIKYLTYSPHTKPGQEGHKSYRVLIDMDGNRRWIYVPVSVFYGTDLDEKKMEVDKWWWEMKLEEIATSMLEEL